MEVVRTIRDSNLNRIKSLDYLVDLIEKTDTPDFMTLRGKYPTIRIPKAYRGKAHNMGLPSSAYDDAKKKLAMLDTNNSKELFMIGFGDGWHIQALLDLDLPNLETLYVAIPDFFNFRYVFDMRHLPMLSDKRLNMVFGEESDVIVAYYEKCAIGGVPVVHNWTFEAYCDATGDYRATMLEIQRINVGGVIHEKETEMMRLNVENTFEIYKKGHDVVDLFGTARGKSIFIIGAGPSLNDSAKIIRGTLEQIRGNVIVFCAVQAHTKYEEVIGFKPDYWVYCDYHSVASDHAPLDWIEKNKKINIICSQEVSRHVSSNWIHENIWWWWDTKVRTHNDINQKIFIDAELSHAASSMTSILDLAIKMRPDDIYLFGIDNGFVDQKDHVEGYNKEGQGYTQENDSLYKGWYVVDVYGNQLETNYPMFEDTRWMSMRLMKDDVTFAVYNFGRGAAFDNTIAMMEPKEPVSGDQANQDAPAIISGSSPDTSPQDSPSPQ